MVQNFGDLIFIKCMGESRNHFMRERSCGLVWNIYTLGPRQESPAPVQYQPKTGCAGVSLQGLSGRSCSTSISSWNKECCQNLAAPTAAVMKWAFDICSFPVKSVKETPGTTST